MNFTDEENESIKGLAPITRAVFETIKKWMSLIIDGKCDEVVMEDAARKIANSTEGYINEDNQVTIDGAMKILGFGQNRVGCINLLRRNGIINKKVNNVHVGYDRDQVVALKCKMRKEYDARILKQENKRRRNEAAKRKREGI